MDKRLVKSADCTVRALLTSPITPETPPSVCSSDTVEKMACPAPEFSGSAPLNESFNTKVMYAPGIILLALISLTAIRIAEVPLIA